MLKIKTVKTIAIISIFFLSNIAFAKEKTQTKEHYSIDLLTKAGTQRMLSQRIAKDYLYVGKNIAWNKANRQLKKSLNDFLDTYQLLFKSVNNPEIKNLLKFVKLSSDELNSTISKKFNIQNAQLILDLSESMSEGSQYIYNSLKTNSYIKNSEVINRVNQELILSQRIAKYYIAYQLNIRDENSVNLMKKAVQEFKDNLDFLMDYNKNTPDINRKLNEIDKLWEIVHKFYNNIEKGGLPLIVFNTTDKIAKKMEEISKLYLSINN